MGARCAGGVSEEMDDVMLPCRQPPPLIKKRPGGLVKRIGIGMMRFQSEEGKENFCQKTAIPIN